MTSHDGISRKLLFLVWSLIIKPRYYGTRIHTRGSDIEITQRGVSRGHRGFRAATKLLNAKWVHSRMSRMNKTGARQQFILLADAMCNARLYVASIMLRNNRADVR